MTVALRDRLAIATRHTARRRFWTRHDRDDYDCPMCGYEAQGLDREFHVHHRDGDWLNNHQYNLVAICHRCHRRAHKVVNRQQALVEWKDAFGGVGR